MPPEFEQWCKTSWLPANLGRDFYRKQAETHIESLALKISNLQRGSNRAGNLLDERDVIQQRLWLQNELDNVSWVMANVLDFVEPGPLLSDEVVKLPSTARPLFSGAYTLSPH